MEHHSNLIPLAALLRGRCVLKFVELTETEEFDLNTCPDLRWTKLVSTVHKVQHLGCINPVQEIIAIAHQYGAKVLIDACQSVPYMPIDVQKMDCDWLAALDTKCAY